MPGVLGDVAYRRDGDTELALDAFVQQGGSRRPLVVVVHGGGWTAGSRVAFVAQLLEVLSEGGFNWVSIDYRLGPPSRYRDAVDDVLAALEFVRCHATALRADPGRLVLLGEDTGAELAALAAARRPPGVAAAVLVGATFESRGEPEPAASRGRTGSPGPAGSPGSSGSRGSSGSQGAGAPVVQGAPLAPGASLAPANGPPPVPTLVVHGTEDAQTPLSQAAAHCDGLRSSGGSCELLRVEGASHRSENWWPSQWGYKRRVLEWLAATVGDPGPYEEVATRLRKRVVYDEEERLHLDAWTPEGSGPFPAAIVVHGGGWEAGDRVTYVTPLFEPLARAGFAWFSIDYRLTPRVSHPEQLDDLRRAIAWVRKNAPRFGVDSDRLALIGESASGQMAMQIATEDHALMGVVPFYGVYDFSPLVTDASPRSLLVRLFRRTVLDEEARAEMRRFSPLYHVRPGMPPVLLVHGTNERLFEQGVAMARALEEKGIPHELVRLEGAPHGLENWEGRPEWVGYKNRLVQWLKALPSPARR